MYRVRTIFTGVVGTPWYSNLFFSDQAEDGPQAAVDAVVAFWETVSGLMHVDVDWEVEGDVAAISEGTDQIENVFPVSGDSGSGLAQTDPNPWMTQGLVRLGTAAFMNGRRIQGRVFIPGSTEEANANGVPSPGYLSTLDGAAETLLASPGVEWVVYSRRNFLASPVISAGVAPYWAVLRSRRD